MKVMRKIITIDEEKCDGCGLCADACHEGAIQMIDGKAKLVRDDYCDGLGDCIGECPQGAITIEERMAEPFDEDAVNQHLGGAKDEECDTLDCGCPGTAVQSLGGEDEAPLESTADAPAVSHLRNWPVQIHLVPPAAPYLDGADVLIASDCSPFAVPDFHDRFLRGRVALVGCPKLDDAERYIQKLADVFATNDIRSIEVLRMEVPCCAGLTHIVSSALQAAEAVVPAGVTTVSPDGAIVDRDVIAVRKQSGCEACS